MNALWDKDSVQHNLTPKAEAELDAALGSPASSSAPAWRQSSAGPYGSVTACLYASAYRCGTPLR